MSINCDVRNCNLRVGILTLVFTVFLKKMEKVTKSHFRLFEKLMHTIKLMCTGALTQTVNFIWPN